MSNFERCCACVDYDQIRHNFLEMKKCVDSNVKMLAVVKADAYGHGVIGTCRVLDDIADFFAVATVHEAVEIRDAGFDKDILILGYVSPSDYGILLERRITPVIFTLRDALKLNDAAASAGIVQTIHLGVDTGMSRIGFQCDEEGIREASAVFELQNLYVEGAFSHFSKADESDPAFTIHQNEEFRKFLDGVGHDIPIKHICNSAGIVGHKDYRYDMVRAGISIYGYKPSDETDMSRVNIAPALSWHTKVSHVKELKAGRIVSYGGTFKAEKDMRIATITIGYADGYPRLLSGKGRVIINGHYAPILGRVCMDQTMVDITDIPDVEVENDVILLGKQGNAEITADDIAELTGTISYEVLCDIGRRVVRMPK